MIPTNEVGNIREIREAREVGVDLVTDFILDLKNNESILFQTKNEAFLSNLLPGDKVIVFYKRKAHITASNDVRQHNKIISIKKLD